VPEFFGVGYKNNSSFILEYRENEEEFPSPIMLISKYTLDPSLMVYFGNEYHPEVFARIVILSTCYKK
jgi:hypothetical protein